MASKPNHYPANKFKLNKKEICVLGVTPTLLEGGLSKDAMSGHESLNSRQLKRPHPHPKMVVYTRSSTEPAFN